MRAEWRCVTWMAREKLCQGFDPIFDEDLVDELAGMLCPPCLELLEIRSGQDFPSSQALVSQEWVGAHASRHVWQCLMCKLIGAHMGCFAFDVQDGLQNKVAWWRLPAPGMPEHDAAILATEKALAWANS